MTCVDLTLQMHTTLAFWALIRYKARILETRIHESLTTISVPESTDPEYLPGGWKNVHWACANIDVFLS